MGKILAILPFFSSQSAEFGKRTPTKFPTKFLLNSLLNSHAHLAIGENLVGTPASRPQRVTASTWTHSSVHNRKNEHHIGILVIILFCARSLSREYSSALAIELAKKKINVQSENEFY